MTDLIDKQKTEIKDFFLRIGVNTDQNPLEHEFWADLWKKIKDKGVDPHNILENCHPMSPEVADLYFMDDEIGLKFLSADFKRFEMILMTIENHEGFMVSPERIIEIGGGPGIVSLWLAKKFKEAACIVYDISENAIKLGRLIANRLGIENIEYRKAGYHELSKTKSHEKGDLILGLSSLFLKVIPEKESEHFSADADNSSFSCPARMMTTDFVKACSNLVREKGLIYFSQGAFNDLGLLTLFSALRNNRLGIDWKLTKAMGEGRGSDFSFREIHIFARQGMPSIFRNAREDLRTFLYSGKAVDGHDIELIGHADYEAWLGLLSDGIKISEIVVKKDHQIHEKFILVCKSGVIGFFSASSSGRRSGFVGAASDFIRAGNRLKSAVDKYTQNGIEIISEYWHPDYEKIKSF